MFGTGTGASNRTSEIVPTAGAAPAVNVEGGGPPATVRAQLQDLEKRIARNPKDDVALTQLGDMYLAVSKYNQAIPLYKRALAVNKDNVAAQEGLHEAQDAVKGNQ